MALLSEVVYYISNKHFSRTFALLLFIFILLYCSFVIQIIDGFRLTLNLAPSCGFPKMFSREGVRQCFFVNFNVSISHAFPEIFIEIPQVVQKISRFSPLILTIFIGFSDFFLFLVTEKLMMSSFFYFQSSLNRLINNWIKLYWLVILEIWKGGQTDSPQRKKLTSKSPALLGLRLFQSIF